MDHNSNNRIIVERIPLFRGGTAISNILGSFGSSLRETRITAYFGFLMSLAPEAFRDLFAITGVISNISLEKYETLDRSDIRLETTSGTLIIEAKIDSTDPTMQVLKYQARWRICITNHRPTIGQSKAKSIKYVNWQQVGNVLKAIVKRNGAFAKHLAADFLNYLERYSMVLKDNKVEVYAREINEMTTLNLFLKTQMYGCLYKKGGRLMETTYFAPHFGENIAALVPGIKSGISYVAKINRFEIVDSYAQLLQCVRIHFKGSWIKKHKQWLGEIHRTWNWGNERYSFVFLDKPRLIFNPPIKKTYLQKGTGWLSKNYFSFDELFRAWGHEKIFKN